MKSLAIGLAGDFWYWLMLILFWGAAFQLFRLSMRRWRTSKHWAALSLGILALWCVLVPHWRSFPGWDIAEAVCRKNGGNRAFQEVPVISEGLLIQEHGLDDKDLARMLLRDGFDFVEEIPHRNAYRGPWRPPFEKQLRYRIGRLTDPECAQFGTIVSQAPDTVEVFYLQGMKADECLVVEPFDTPEAAVTLRHYEEFKFLPTPISYSVNDVIWTESKEPIAELRGFYYYKSDPRRDGNPEFIDCFNTQSRSRANGNRGWVVGTSGRLPKQIVPVNGSEPSAITAPINFRVDLREEIVTGSQRVDFFKAAIGLGQPDSELWSIDDGEQSLLAVMRSGAAPVAYSIPSLDRTIVAPETLDHHWKYSRLGTVLGYRNIEGNLVIIRSHGGTWEVGELNAKTSEWRRTYVRVLDAFREAHPSNSDRLPVIVRRLDVVDDTIELEAAVMASEYAIEDAKTWATIAFTLQRPSSTSRRESWLPQTNGQ